MNLPDYNFIPTPEQPTLKLFMFSVVGLVDGEPANSFGYVAAECQEYARRHAAAAFRKQFPDIRIETVGILELTREHFTIPRI